MDDICKGCDFNIVCEKTEEKIKLCKEVNNE